MTAQDREAINEMMINAINGLGGRFDLIEYKLNEIKEQTTKTNGRVTKLEEKELLHVVNCPQNVRLEKIEDTQKGTTVINKWLVRVVAIAASLVGMTWALIQIITKL